jgi:hypothetical protein
MLTKYICPDGGEIELNKCITDGGCRMANRCICRPMLKRMAEQREWKGVPSTTQLLKGTRQAYLEIVNNYSVKPDDRVFMILGTTIHNDLESQGDAVSMAEIDLSDDEGSVRPDLLEYENGEYTMIDYKVCGSYVVEKALGLYKVDVPDLDPETGEQLLYKTGDKKGKPKTHKVTRQDDTKIDLKDWPLQLNNYRIGLETKLGIKIKRMIIQAIVRDGGTAIAVGRGVIDKAYQIDIPMIEDAEVKEYFTDKKAILLTALEQKKEPFVCFESERWDEDRKCTDYCPVNKFCSYWKEKYQADITTNENWEG